MKIFEEQNGRKPDEKEYAEIKARTLSTVRGTVQADQLKESMGQNTLVFNLDTALRMMGDVAEFYVDNEVRIITSFQSQDIILQRQVLIRFLKQP